MNSTERVEAAAHAAADRLAAALRDETGLFPVTLTETADRIAKETGAVFEHQDVGLMLRDKMAKPYADALYGIGAIGRIAATVSGFRPHHRSPLDMTWRAGALHRSLKELRNFLSPMTRTEIAP